MSDENNGVEEIEKIPVIEYDDVDTFQRETKKERPKEQASNKQKQREHWEPMEPESKTMELSIFVEKMRDILTRADKIEENIVNATVSIMSPAFTTNSCMPAFVKKLQVYKDVREPLQDTELFRSKTLSIEFGNLSKSLAKLQEQVHGLQSRLEGESSLVVSTADQAPNVNGLRQSARTTFARDAPVSTRLEKIVALFEGTIAKSRYNWHMQTIIGESATHSAKALSESLLKTIYMEPSRLATVFKAEFDRSFTPKIVQMQKWNYDQKRKLMVRQKELHKLMFELVRHQHQSSRHLIKILSDHIHSLPQRERTNASNRLRELSQNSEQLFVQAEIYYQQPQPVLTQQPMSPLLHERAQKGFCDLQICLCQILTSLVRSNEDQNGPKEHHHDPAIVKNSILYKFANQMDAERLADRAVSLLSQPSSGTVSDILQSFVAFFSNQTKQNLERAKKKCQELEVCYHNLAVQVKKIQSEQQNWLSHSDNAILPSEGKNDTRSAQTIRALLRQGTDLRSMSAELQQTYGELFNVAQPEYLRAEEAKLSTENFMGFMNDYKKNSNYWDQLVTSERELCAHRFVHARAASRYASGIFLEWNHFLTTEMDDLGQTLSIYSVAMFQKIEQLVSDWAIEYQNMNRQRQIDLENEMTLIDRTADDLRKFNIGSADEVAQISKSIKDWIFRNDKSNLLSIQNRWLTEADFHIGRLQELLDLWSPSRNSREPLRLYLDMLDTMYDTTSFGVQGKREAEQIRQHDQKIQLASKQLLDKNKNRHNM